MLTQRKLRVLTTYRTSIAMWIHERSSVVGYLSSTAKLKKELKLNRKKGISTIRKASRWHFHQHTRRDTGGADEGAKEREGETLETEDNTHETTLMHT